jgi:hypothetical protein
MLLSHRCYGSPQLLRHQERFAAILPLQIEENNNKTTSAQQRSFPMDQIISNSFLLRLSRSMTLFTLDRVSTATALDLARRRLTACCPWHALASAPGSSAAR